MVRITESLPATGFALPTAAEVIQLAGIIRRQCGWIHPFDNDSFGRAFWAIGHQFRLRDTDRRVMFHTHVARVNELLASRDLPAVGGPSVLASVVAHGDVFYRRHNGRFGQLLEVALSHVGPGASCANAWRGVLRGEALKCELPPRQPPGAPLGGLPSFTLYRV